MFVTYPINDDDYDEYVFNEMEYNYGEGKDISDESYELAHGIFRIFQDMIDEEEQILNEQFVSTPCARNHFEKHCMANKRKSTHRNVLYDFTNMDDYVSYEDTISNLTAQIVEGNKMFIQDIADTPKLMSALRELFKGGKTLVFSLSCGFTNTWGEVRICLHSWASDVTTNYKMNTVDFLVQAPDYKTVSLYPVDAYYLERVLNREIHKIPKFNGMTVGFNH